MTKEFQYWHFGILTKEFERYSLQEVLTLTIEVSLRFWFADNPTYTIYIVAISMSEIRVPSTELQGERTSVDVDFRNEQDKQHPQMANTVEPNVENAKHEHHPRQCQPPNVPFSSEKFTEIYLKLDTLKNLVGLISVCIHWLSGNHLLLRS